ncbi:Endoribonuclease Dicer-like protein 2-like [Oopsacas minuta]|uniref:Endoribonuclease Dicer-like protein 2-like n=1 Tax=Oopsacas minuta TaxID=111878 RepID=A0AAV7KFY4_9METZ|nr:Endoribonuclease Dicer-like protein 2-like [Oopsacas minuta]
MENVPCFSPTEDWEAEIHSDIKVFEKSGGLISMDRLSSPDEFENNLNNLDEIIPQNIDLKASKLHRHVENTATDQSYHQTLLVEEILTSNSILFLDRFVKRMFTTVLVIRALCQEILGRFFQDKLDCCSPLDRSNFRRSVVVCTPKLLSHYHYYLCEYLPKMLKTMIISGSVLSWNLERFENVMEMAHVFITTQQVLYDLLKSHLFISDFNLIVFDDVYYNYTDENNRIIDLYKQAKIDIPKRVIPRILGLSFCLFKGVISNPNSKIVRDYLLNLSSQFNSRIITSQKLLESSRSLKQPIYLILPYSKEDASGLHLYLEEKLNEYISFLRGINSHSISIRQELLNELNSKKVNGSIYSPRLIIFDLDMLISISTDIYSIIREIGYWGSFTICMNYLQMLKHVYTDFQNQIIVSAIINLTSILQYYTYQILKIKEPTMNDISTKFSIFINELKLRCYEKRFNAIIIINNKTTAYIISEYLKVLSNQYRDYECFKVEHLLSPDSYCSLYHSTQGDYYTIIEKFRVKELNLLITDDDLLNTVDLPICDAVIVFNRITDFAFFTLSQSIIRDNGGIYLCLSKQDEQHKVSSEIQSYVKFGILYREIILSDFIPIDLHIDSDNCDTDMYRNNLCGPLTTLNAIPILERYCQFLVGARDSDLYTNYKPIYKCESRKEVSYFTGDLHFEYKYDILLPKSSFMVNYISLSDMWSNSKLSAKRLAACEVCKELYEKGELNENMTPKIRWIKQCENYMSFSRHPDEQEIQLYQIKVADCLGSPIQSNQKIYMQSYYLTEDGHNSNISRSIKSFALLSESMLNLHKFPSIVLNNNNKRINYVKSTVEFLEPLTVTLSESELQDVHLFNSTMFRFTLGNKGSVEYDYSQSDKRYLIVPTQINCVNRSGICSYTTSIDFKILKTLKNWPFLTERFRENQDANYYIGMIVKKNYTSNSFTDKTNYFHVIDSDPLIHIDSLPPDKSNASSYTEYFKKFHHVQLTNTNQVSLILEPFPNIILNRLKRYESNLGLQTKMDKQNQESLSFPELLSPVPLLGTLTPEYQAIPSVCRRIEAFLLTQELCDKLKLKLPILSCLTALTLKRTEEGFNLERQEFFGDVCLGFIVVNHLFLMFPNENQGVLSCILSNRVKNSLLFKLSLEQEIHLPQYISGREFNPRTNWYPPGFIVTNIKETMQLNDTVSKDTRACDIDFSTFDSPIKTLSPSIYTHQELSDKSIADSFEALLAVIISNSGLSSLIVFLYRFDSLSVIREIEPELIENISTNYVYDPDHFKENPFYFYLQGKHCINYIYSKYYRPNYWSLETYKNYLKYFHNTHILFAVEKLNYFYEMSQKDIYTLVQALTHDSYIMNSFTPSYHRLMFLGDAIVNYLIASYLMTHAPDYYLPKDLHIIKTCVLLNINLARICIKHEFHKEILLTNPQLHTGIDVFIHFVKNINEQAFFQKQLSLVSQCISGKIFIEDTVHESQKVLSDIYKSLVGSIYIISKYDLVQVWMCFGEELSDCVEIFLKQYSTI